MTTNKSDLQNFVKRLVNGEKLSTSFKVFVSSSKEDLTEQRMGVQLLIEELGLTPVGMETFGAHPAPPLDICLRHLNESKIYLGILGMRYGSIYQNESDKERHNLSYTEIEYDYAYKKTGMPILIYCIDEREGYIHPIHYDPNNLEKLRNFKNKVCNNHTIDTYVDTEDLLRKITRDLVREAKCLEPRGSQQKKITKDQESVTMSASGDGSYYLSDTLRFSGTSISLNSTFVYLYLHKLDQSSHSDLTSLAKMKRYPLTENNQMEIAVPVMKDYTWEYKWDVSRLIGTLTAGTYIILATMYPIQDTEQNQGGIEYATVSINLKTPYCTCIPNSTHFVRGSRFDIMGTATTNQEYLYAWICTDKTFIHRAKIPIEPDNTYHYDLSYLEDYLTIGERYFLIIQVPLTCESGEVQYYSGTPSYIAKKTIDGAPDTSSQIDLSETTLINNLPTQISNLISSTNGKDLYTKFTFTFEEPSISNIREEKRQNTLILTGSTNLPPGTKLHLELHPEHHPEQVPSSILTAFLRTQKPEYEKTILVDQNDSINIWSAKINLNSLFKGRYILHITLNSTAQELAVYTINI